MTLERRAEFDELVDALERAYGAYLTVPFGRRSEALSEKLIAARARVLALYAERQGEVYEVAFIQPDCGDPTVPEHAEEWGVGLHGTMPGWLHPGDRVRVTKVEEGQ